MMQQNPENEHYILTAECKQVEYTYFTEGDIPEIVNKRLLSQAVALEDCALAVYHPELEEGLEIDVLTSMRFPIIITENDRVEYYKNTKGLSNSLPYDPSKKWLVVVGNQRYIVARDNGFTHIDAFVVGTGAESIIVKKAYENG
jgi:hypothetical protein